MDIIWNQGGFEKLLESLPSERKKEDAKRLRAIFNKAAKSPTLQAELTWAREHGIKFFIDHTCQRAQGYYPHGTGVVAIAKNKTWLTDEEVLAHEIRHAWQDYHGLLPDMTKQDFLAYYSHLSIVEADATAFQKATKFECMGWPTVSRWDEFTHWYSSLAVTYGGTAARQYAREIGINGSPPPDYHFEFKPGDDSLPPARRLPDTSAQKVFPLLNRDFSGKEYFNKTAVPDFLKKIEDGPLAAKFYQARLKEPDKLVQAICAKDALMKLLPPRRQT